MVADPRGFEPQTFGLEGQRAIRAAPRVPLSNRHRLELHKNIKPFIHLGFKSHRNKSAEERSGLFDVNGWAIRLS